MLHGHDHDHMLAKQEKDGIIYQLGLRPSFRSKGGEKNCDTFGYNFWPGTVCVSSSGHLRSKVNGGTLEGAKPMPLNMCAQLPRARRWGVTNGMVSDTCTINA